MIICSPTLNRNSNIDLGQISSKLRNSFKLKVQEIRSAHSRQADDENNERKQEEKEDIITINNIKETNCFNQSSFREETLSSASSSSSSDNQQESSPSPAAALVLNKERKSVSSKNIIQNLHPCKKKPIKFESKPVSISPKKADDKPSKFKIALEILRKQQEEKMKNMKVLDKPEIPCSIHNVKQANNQRSRLINAYQTFDYFTQTSPKSKFEAKKKALDKIQIVKTLMKNNISTLKARKVKHDGDESPLSPYN